MVFTLSNPVDLESWSRRLIFVFQNAPLPNKNYESTSDTKFFEFLENFSKMFFPKFTILWNGSKHDNLLRLISHQKEHCVGEWVTVIWLELMPLSLKIVSYLIQFEGMNFGYFSLFRLSPVDSGFFVIQKV